MKKIDQDTSLLNNEITPSEDIDVYKIKTTNVNILLNRVRLDNKRIFIKRLILSGTIIITISSIFAFVVL